MSVDLLVAMALVVLATEIFFAATFVLAVRSAVHHPRRANVDVALFFGTLACLMIGSRVLMTLDVAVELRTLWIEATLLALPYLLMRVVHDFAELPGWALPAVAVALVIQAVTLALIGGQLPPALLAATGTAYVVVPIAWSSLIFVREARRSRGVTRRRFVAVAAGTVLLALNVTFLALPSAVPGLSDSAAVLLAILYQVFGLGSGVAYVVGFAPPVWLRDVWQHADLRSFLLRAPELAAVTDLDELLGMMAFRARQALGYGGVLIGVWDETGTRLKLRGTGVPYEASAEDTFAGRAIQAGHAIASFDPIREVPARAELYVRTNAKMLVAAPIRSGGVVLGALTARSSHVSLFMEDDLRLCQMLADQAAFLLRNRALVLEARESHDRLRSIVDSAHDSIIGIDRGGRIVEWNDRAAQVVGWAKGEAIGRDAATIFAHGMPNELKTRLEEPVADEPERGDVFESDIRGASGHEIAVEVALAPTPGRGPTALTMFLRDIRERRQLELEREHRADHDALTGLPNSRLLDQHLLETSMTASIQKQPYALLLMDLDNFAEVNQTFGHAIGDRVLIEIAERLKTIAPPPRVVGRWSGDQFAVLLPREGLGIAEQVAARILASFERPFSVDRDQIEVGVSIGIASYPDHAQDARALVAAADIALVTAKRSANTYAVYPVETHPLRSGRFALRADLRRAIDSGALELHYQPIVSMRSGEVERFEALARWSHPQRGPVPPSEFIDLAERTGLIRPLTEWVLDRATADAARWRRDDPGLRVSVNLSTRAFADAGLFDRIGGAILRAGCGDDALCVEITESILMTEPERARQTIQRLRDRGIRVEVDDFGTGYSSLAYLQRLPVDAVKIDRSFVAAMARETHSDAIVRATIRLSHELGFEVIGEGVEDRAQWDRLAASGCDAAQGYHIARPMPAATVAGWLLGRRRPAGSAALRQLAAVPVGKRFVLIVDDDPAIVTVMRDVLREHGYEVATAANGEEALDLIAQARPSLVLLDVHMPVLDGSQFADALRERGIRVPVVVMTAGPSARDWAEKLAASGHLAKPFAVDQLLSVTERFLRPASVRN